MLDYDWISLRENGCVKVLSVGDVRCSNVVNFHSKFILVVVFPGNPGSCHFYSDFALQLYSDLQAETDLPVAVWVPSMIGHTACGDVKEKRERPQTVSQQLANRKAFLLQTVPDTALLYLAGHSIGAFLALHSFESTLHSNKQLRSLHLLCPTIERMVNTRNGRLYRPVLCTPLYWILVLLVWFVSLLSSEYQKRLVQFAKPDFSPKAVDGVLNLLRPKVVRNCIKLSVDELRLVRSLESTHTDVVLRNHKDQIRAICSANDWWSPLSYWDALRSDMDLSVHVCPPQVTHAFVVHRDGCEYVSKRMKADILTDIRGDTD